MTTTNTNRSKTRERHSSEPTRSTTRPGSWESSQASGSEGNLSRSADDIRESVKETVGKGVAAVAGAVEGVAETMEETELQQSAESAVRQVGETAHKVVRAAKEETENIKHALKGEPAEFGEDAEDDFQTEKDDPTFSGSGSRMAGSGIGSGSSLSASGPSLSGPSLAGPTSTGSSSNRRPTQLGDAEDESISYGGTGSSSSTYSPDDDEDESKAI